MEGITLFMALVDLIPVVCFFIATYILMKDLYKTMNFSSYALLASGSIIVFLAGAYKVTWKFLYALRICDWVVFNKGFFMIQAPGFVLIAAGLIKMIIKTKKELVEEEKSNLNTASLNCFIPVSFIPFLATAVLTEGVVPEYTSNMPFVFVQVLGSATVMVSMCIISRWMKNNMAFVLYIIYFVFALMMGYLSSKFDDSSSMHWIAQLVNSVSQICFLLATIRLHRAGLSEKFCKKNGSCMNL